MTKAWRIALLVFVVLAWLLLATLQSRLLLTGLVGLVVLPRRFGVGLAVVAFVGVIVLLPRRTADPNARVQSIVLDANGARVPMPWLPYLANLVPESDLIRVTTLAKAVFPFPTRGGLLTELRDMNAWDNPFVREYARFRDGDFDRSVPSVLALQLAQQLGLYRGLHHVVLVRPLYETPAATPAPVVVFLHGYMGNFQFYTSYFAALPTHALLLPSTPNLLGMWTNADLAQILGRDLDALAALTPIDRARLHLVGLSNGGSGVNRAVQTRASTFRSFTFLSTWVGDVPSSVHAPLGVIYGDRDGIASNNAAAIPRLRAAGHVVSAHAFARERHFLMLTRRDEVQAAIAQLVAR